jgi:hypothetical protein
MHTVGSYDVGVRSLSSLEASEAASRARSSHGAWRPDDHHAYTAVVTCHYIINTYATSRVALAGTPPECHHRASLLLYHSWFVRGATALMAAAGRRRRPVRTGPGLAAGGETRAATVLGDQSGVSGRHGATCIFTYVRTSVGIRSNP